MQLCIENVDQAGGCAYGYACVYTDTISWASPTEPLPMIRDPRVAFDQLFGAGRHAGGARGAPPHATAASSTGSPGEVAELKRELGPTDRAAAGPTTSRTSARSSGASSGSRRTTPAASRASCPRRPAGVPDSFEEHVKLMFDLQALAFASDMTRVFSFKMGRDASGRVYPGERRRTRRSTRPRTTAGTRSASSTSPRSTSTTWSMLPYFLEKLKDTMEGDGNLLDKTMIVYGSPMGDSQPAQPQALPAVRAGRRERRSSRAACT